MALVGLQFKLDGIVAYVFLAFEFSLKDILFSSMYSFHILCLGYEEVCHVHQLYTPPLLFYIAPTLTQGMNLRVKLKI